MKKIKVYIIQNPLNEERFLVTRERMISAHLEPIRSVVEWEDPELNALYAGIIRVKTENYYKAIISNSLAHTRSWEKIANDATLKLEDWSLVVEDDACFNPSILNSEIPKIIHEFLETVDNVGFAYLGVCAHRIFSKPESLSNYQNIKVVRVSGPCAHAYAIQKHTASFFLNKVIAGGSSGDDFYSAPLDRHLKVYWRKQGGAPICGINFTTPLPDQKNNHRGIVFQDREMFDSDIVPFKRENSVSD